MSSWTTKFGLLWLALAALLTSGCAGVHGPYVWVDDYGAPIAPPSGYTIGVGDLLNIQVWGQDKISTKARVRSDGRISLPLLSDVEVAGKAPRDLSRELETRLTEANLVVNPRVNVEVDEIKPLSVSILGAVTRPGTYSLDPGTGVAVALASAGGLTEFAHKDRIFVVRQTPRPVRIRFTLEALTSASGAAPAFRLQPGDLVVVE